MQQPFKLQPSRHLASTLAVAHIIALAALIPLDFPVWAKLVLGLAVLYSLLHCLRRDVWICTRPSTTVLVLKNDGTAQLQRNGKMLEGRILPSSVVSPYIIVLNIAPKESQWAQSLVILSDCLDAESFRQIRVQLKWGMVHKGEGAAMHLGFL